MRQSCFGVCLVSLNERREDDGLDISTVGVANAQSAVHDVRLHYYLWRHRQCIVLGGAVGTITALRVCNK